MDLNFPVIKYELGQSHALNGEMHGESYREAIRELAQIRKNLMFERNPGLRGSIVAGLAKEQWSINTNYFSHLGEELEGIRRGADISVEDIVILNNYTDFRDIDIDDQGCSTVFVKQPSKRVAGQTWDMHSSAMRFVCVLQLSDEMLLFSLVGCIGMMGFHRDGRMIGVNNLNSTDAKPGVIWPALVRATLEQPSYESMQASLRSAVVTSAHNYLIADCNSAGMWEVLPSLARCTGSVKKSDSTGYLFHTNHCLNPEVKHYEAVIGKASTSKDRFELLEKKVPKVIDMQGMHDLLCDHENYPRSICSHYESGSQDPSFTCGGAVGELTQGQFSFWRGCREADNYVEHNFKIVQGQFERS